MQDRSLTGQPAEFPEPLKRQSGKDILNFALKTSLACLTVFLVFLIYSSSLQGPFLLDDGSNIKNNPAIRLTQFSWSGLKKAAFNSPLPNRPLAYISFALNYYCHSYRTVGFRLVNILIHMSAGVLLFLFNSNYLNDELGVFIFALLLSELGAVLLRKKWIEQNL